MEEVHELHVLHALLVEEQKEKVEIITAHIGTAKETLIEAKKMCDPLTSS